LGLSGTVGSAAI